MKNKNYIQKSNDYNLGPFLLPAKKDKLNKQCYNVIKVGETNSVANSQYTNNSILKQMWTGAELNNVFVANNPKSGTRNIECRLIDLTANKRWRIKNLQGGNTQEFSALVPMSQQIALGCALAHFTFNEVDILDMPRFKPTQKGKKTIMKQILRFDKIVVDDGFRVLPFGRFYEGGWEDGEYNTDPSASYYRGENYSDVAQKAVMEFDSINPWSFNFMKLEVKKAMVAVG